MKKFALLLALSFCVIAFPGVMFGDGPDPVPHVVIGNLIKASGGNKNIKLGQFYYYDSQIVNSKGFDIKAQ